MDLYQSYTLGSFSEHIAPISTKSDIAKSPLNASFVIMKWPCLVRERKKTYTLQCFGEFANRKKEH